MSNWEFTEQNYELLLSKIEKVEALVEKQNSRVAKLEAWRNWLIGAWASLSLILMLLWKK